MTEYTQGYTKRIYNVHWNVGPNIAVLEFSYGCQWIRPFFPFNSLRFTSDTPDITQFPLEYLTPTAGSAPPLVDPFSDNMLKKVFMWNRDTFFTLTDDGVYLLQALFFFNLTRIKAELPALTSTYSFTIDTPAESSVNQTGSIFWVWDTLVYPLLSDAKANPYTAGSPFTCPGPYCSPSGIITLPLAYSSFADASAAVAVANGNGTSMELTIQEEVTDDKLQTELSWDTRISTYTKRKSFDSDGPSPNWNPNSESISHTRLFSDVPATAKTLTFTINFATLATSITS